MIPCYYCGSEIIAISKDRKTFFKCQHHPTLETKQSPDNEKRLYLKAVFANDKNIPYDVVTFIKNELMKQSAEEQSKRDQRRREQEEELKYLSEQLINPIDQAQAATNIQQT